MVERVSMGLAFALVVFDDAFNAAGEIFVQHGGVLFGGWMAVFVKFFNVEVDNSVRDLFVLDKLGKGLDLLSVELVVELGDPLGASVHLRERSMKLVRGRTIRTLTCICHFSNLILQNS